MRALPAIIASLAFCAVTRLADAKTPGTWFVEASAAYVSSSWQDEAGSGTAWNAAVGQQTLPWLALTGEGGLLRADGAFAGAEVPEERWTIDAATHATLMVGVRLGPPIDLGLTPSLEFGTGLGWLHWGDRHFTSMSGGGTETIVGDHDVAWGWSAGLRLRYATRPRMLTPEAAVRALGFAERGHPVMVTLGFGLRY